MNFEPQSKFDADELENLIDQKPRLGLSGAAKTRIEKARKAVERLENFAKPIYGVNTGFGRLARIKISPNELGELQLNLIRSHACGVGAPLSPRVVKRLLLLRMLSLGKGASGIQLSTFNRHLDFWNKDLCPYIPEKGSVGASGDLAPLAHLALSLIGEGEFIDSGRRLSAAPVFKKHRLKKLNILSKEGLSLTNGTQVSLALGLEALREIKRLYKWMIPITALSVEAHSATSKVYDARIHKLKAHAEQQEIAADLMAWLKGSEHMNSHRECDQVQDSYSFRAVPQILAPCLKFIRTAEEMMEGEISSVSDNPVFVKGSTELHSCGHFHAQMVSMASDLITQAAVTMGNLSERRLDQLVNPLTTRTTAFLAEKPGVESGLMIVQTAAAALASENKTLVFPASADTISTNGNQEDHVSMGPWAARKALQVCENLESILAFELVAAIRGAMIEKSRNAAAFAPKVEKFLNDLQKACPSAFRAGDRVFSRDVGSLKAFLSIE